ncbi:MAG: ATP-binding protein [Microthrixaceae bacterium]|nr:ATP-binding protein [Microthrixaceae bacterium]
MNLLICSPSTFTAVFERLCETYDWACTLVEAYEAGLLSDQQLPDGTLVINPRDDWPLERIAASVREAAPNAVIAGAFVDDDDESFLTGDQFDGWLSRTVPGTSTDPSEWADDFCSVRLDDGGTPAEVRHWVADQVQRWGFDDLSLDAQLVASELATNALTSRLSAQLDDPIEVEAARVDRTVLLSVVDTSPEWPVPVPASEARITGRGLRVVSEVANWWGVTAWDASKVVWAELVA